MMCVLPTIKVNTQVHYNLVWFTSVWNYFSTFSTSDEGSFLFISYKIGAYGWPVSQGMCYCIYYELNQYPFSTISPLSIPLPTINLTMFIEVFVLQWLSVTSQ